MSEWKRYKLGELLSIKHGWAFKSENYVKDGKTALVTLRNISEDSRFVFDVNKTTYYGGEYPEEYNLNEGDLIIPLTEQVVGLLGNSAFVPNFSDIKFVLNQRVGKVQEKYEKIDKIFLKYLLSTTTVRTQMEYRASGTKQRNISPKDIYDIEVYIPELVIQKYIGRILYNLDKKIQINNQINQELEAMAKTLYDYWFVQFDFPDQNGKPYKSSGGKMVYHPELKREIPEGWGVEKLENVANITMGQSPKGSSYNETGEGIMFFQGSTDFGWRFPVARQYTTEPSRIAEEDDILLSVRAPVGTLNIADTRCCIGRGLAAINSKVRANSYIFNVMQDFKKPFDMMNSAGTTFGSITKDALYSLQLVYPPTELLMKFDKSVKSFDKEIKNRSRQNQELTQLRDWLLPILINGQVYIRIEGKNDY